MRKLRNKTIALSFALFFSLVFSISPVFANNNADTNNSTLSVSSGSVPADGSTTATISVTVKDSSGNTLSGDTVTLTSTSDSGLVINNGAMGADNGAATTDSNGNVSFTINSNNQTTDTFTATDTSDNPPITLGSNGNVTVTFSLTPTPTPASCTDSAPGSTPQLTSAIADSENQITLTWTDATDPVSFYLIAYGTSSGQYIYGNPNVGGQGATSYTVNSLAAGTRYYFVVRAVNGCNAGSFSNEISATTTNGVVASTLTPTQVPIIDTDTPTPTDTPAPSQHVTPTAPPAPKKTSAKGSLITIFLLILVLGGIGGFIYRRHKKRKTE